MSDKTKVKLEAGALSYMHPSEEILATLIASVRGHQQAMAGGIAGMVGGGRAARAATEAQTAGVVLASPMAFVLTRSRVLTFELGNGGKVKRFLGEYLVTSIDDMQVKRLGLGASVSLTINGAEVRLESRVNAARSFADTLSKTKSTV